MSAVTSFAALRRACAAGAVALLLAGCSSATSDDSATSASPTSSADGKKHGKGHGKQHGKGHDASGNQGSKGHHASGGQHASGGKHASGGHHASGALSKLLIEQRDVPAGYIPHSGHGTYPGAGRIDIAPGCAPIAHLIGTESAAQPVDHPKAQVTFGKAHFGPQLSESIIDYGSVPAATSALRRVETAVSDCARYEQSGARTGANRYTVAPLELESAGSDPAVAMRLSAIGADFEDVRWDVVVTRSGSRLVAVGFRTPVGGDNADLRPTLRAALERLADA